jgi:hypothetical protein
LQSARHSRGETGDCGPCIAARQTLDDTVSVMRLTQQPGERYLADPRQRG